MTDNELPKLTETEITDLWRFRQEHKDSEDFHATRRKAADQEVLRRAVEKEAQVLGTDAGDITITYSSIYAYDSRHVDGDFFALIERDKLQADWNQNVSHAYKIKRTWLNHLLGRGKEYIAAINRMTIATHGSPTIDGPPLAAMGEYAIPEEIPTP